MLIRRDKRSTLAPLGIPRICRDAVALSHITRGLMRYISSGNPHLATFTDYFDLVPVRLANGKAVIIDSPALLDYDPHVKPQDLRLVHPVHVPISSGREFEHDEHLLHALTKAVEHFIRGRRRPALRQIFRSLAMSYHACRALTETESTYYDLGTRVVEWISAFEILCHPERGEVKKKDVLDLIDAVPWARLWRLPSEQRADILRRLTDRRHKCSDGKNPKRRNAACHFYDQLYRLRNDLAHGNQVKQRKFFARSQPGRWRVDRTTPLLFQLCLMQKLRQIGMLPERSDGPVTPGWVRTKAFERQARERWDETDYQKAFAKALFEEAPD